MPFLVVAAWILLVRPDDTARLFAWPITPPLTAMLLGSAYLGGAYFFTRVVFERRWHRVTLGFPAVAAFASLLGIATALHWERFTHGHASFVAWAALYYTTPFLVAAVWLYNRRRDPGRSEGSRDALITPGASRTVAGVGLGTTALAVLMFARPQLLAEVWPWPIAPLTGRVLASLFALQGIIAIGISLDRRWSAARIMAQTALVMLTSVAVSFARDWGSVDTGRPGAWPLVGGLTALIAAWAGFYVAMQRRV